MHSFAYHRASSLADAVQRTATAQALAGGQSLRPAMKLGLAAPDALVDVGGLADLQGISRDGDALVIGAGTTLAAVATSPVVRSAIPALADLAGLIGDRQVRHRGTLGGSLANNDPAACYPAAVLALNATVHTTQRTIAADDFFVGVYTTALEPGELITRVSFPVPQAAGWQKFKQPASRFALVGVFVARSATGARVAVTGGGNGVFRCAPLEAALSARWAAAACDGVAVPADALASDLHASAAYRAALIPVLAGRAVGA
jgi:carbon-monoxide dehydrogenase medium subunit